MTINALNTDDTFAASTLNPKSMAYDDFESDVRAAAIENYQRLNANQKARYIDFLEKVFTDSAWAKHGTGVKGKNIPFNREETQLDDCFLTAGIPTNKA